ncbi:hypothetical protein HUA74_20030 [Myxococcus sp. CA051A]|uniref:hypothetical protein n=1 Tax=Myxococcus sp. CA051A TaxID=2741739 RepID=UPI00157AF585|nr:hypothetical protein [Myxococcus sp. CA051A]NTX62942.1 hypothetical protein [Myxococcus sp. CA051A]
MAWWNELMGRVSGAGRSPALAQRVEVAPGLTVSVTRHARPTSKGPVDCVSYVSDGLAAKGQKELVFTLPAGMADEAFSSKLFSFFATINQFAEQGRTVDTGGHTQFGQRSLFPGRHLLYVPAEPLPEVSVPANALAAVPVTEGELVLVERFGATRVMSSLGRMCSHFPCPTWFDPERPELPHAEMLQASMLSNIASARLKEARVLQMGSDIVLRLVPGAEALLQQLFAELPANMPFALLTGLDPTADAYFVWAPGQREPQAITPPGQNNAERLCGNFLVVVPEQEKDASQLVEDGFAWLLTEASWKAVKRALTEGGALALLDSAGSKRLRIEWA